MKENFKSDFCAIVTLKNKNLSGVPFRFRYYTTDPNEYYEASYDGVSQGQNVKKLSDTKYQIAFNASHGMAPGRVNVIRTFSIPNDAFEDGFEDKVFEEPTGIELTEGISDNVTSPAESIVGLNLIKPIRGVDYLTPAEIDASQKACVNAAMEAVGAELERITETEEQIAKINPVVHGHTTTLAGYSNTLGDQAVMLESIRLTNEKLQRTLTKATEDLSTLTATVALLQEELAAAKCQICQMKPRITAIEDTIASIPGCQCPPTKPECQCPTDKEEGEPEIPYEESVPDYSGELGGCDCNTEKTPEAPAEEETTNENA